MLSAEIKQHLMQAIDQMESACAEARRAVESLSKSERAPIGITNANMYAIEKVLHTFSWAQANAFGRVQLAMSQYEHEIIFQKLEEGRK